MRITSTMFPTSLIAESNTLQSKEFDVQNQIASGMSILNPSDAPGTFSQISALREENSLANNYLAINNTATLSANDTFQGISSLQSILSSVSETMTEANSSTSQSQQAIYGQQLQTYAQQILSIINQKSSDGSYTFGGVGNQPPMIAQTTSTNTLASALAGISGTDTLTVNGQTISLTSSDTLATLQNKLDANGTGVTASLDPSGNLVLSSTTGDVSVSDSGNFLTGLGYAGSSATANLQLNNTAAGYMNAVAKISVNSSLTVNLGFTAGSNTSGADSFGGLFTDGSTTGTDLYNLVVNASNDLLNASGAGADAFAGDASLGNSYSNAIDTFNSAIDNVSTYVGRASAELALLSANQTDLNNTIVTQKQTLNTLSAVNTATAATNLATIQTAYQAALSAGSKILNLSLMNYLS